MEQLALGGLQNRRIHVTTGPCSPQGAALDRSVRESNPQLHEVTVLQSTPSKRSGDPSREHFRWKDFARRESARAPLDTPPTAATRGDKIIMPCHIE